MDASFRYRLRYIVVTYCTTFLNLYPQMISLDKYEVLLCVVVPILFEAPVKQTTISNLEGGKKVAYNLPFIYLHLLFLAY